MTVNLSARRAAGVKCRGEKNMKKKLFALVLALVLCLGLLPAAGAAYMGDFDIKDGVLRSYFGGDSELTIPAGVTKIGPYAVSNRPNLTSVTIPSGVTSIEEGAFRSCEKLVSVTIPSSVTSIGTRAFNDCTSLTSITIPSSVRTIGVGAFQRCTGLTSVNLPGNNAKLLSGAFEDCTGLTSVTIPEGYTNIGEGAFMGCTNLTRVTIPASVTSIDSSAFGDCVRLTDVYYGGSKAQWSAIVVDNRAAGNRYLVDAAIHFDSGSPAETQRPMALASTQSVTVDGKKVEFQMYALTDASGNGTNYVKLRDMAYVLNGTKAQFSVGYDNASKSISVATGRSYQAGGTEMKTPFSGDRTYTGGTQTVQVDGKAVSMEAITLVDDNGGGYNYFKLRDLGAALGFNVGWSKTQGVLIESDKPYSE